MTAARKPTRRKSTVRTDAKSKGGKPEPGKTLLPLPESDAFQAETGGEADRAKGRLEAARDRYSDLYDLSPAGHLTLDRDCTIVEANLMAATLFDTDRKALIGQPLARFIAAEDQGLFHRHCQEVLSTGTRQTCEVQLRSRAGACLYVYLKSLAAREESGRVTHWRTALLDISDRKRAEQQVEAQRAQLEAIIGTAMDAIITLDEDERVVLFNHAAEVMFRCRAADAIGQPFDRFIPERFRHAHHGHMSAFAGETTPAPRAMQGLGRLYGLRADGDEFPFEASISHVRVDGKTLFTAMLRDITEQKAAAEALRSSETFTRAVLNSLSAHVCVLGKEGGILRTNDAWKEFARNNSDPGLVAVDVGQNYLEVCRRAIAGGQPAAKIALKGIEAVLAGRVPSFTQEYDCHSPEEQRWFLMRVTPLKGTQGAVISHTDISERVRMARELEQSVRLLGEKRGELEALAGKLIEAQEQERKRIARELHDDFNQRLAALAVELECLERAPIPPPEAIARQLAVIRGQVMGLSDDLHDLAYKLHPSLLDHVGLEVAMRDHIAEFTKRTGLPVTFTSREVPKTLSLGVATNLYRVMQESLQNVFKHAQATDVGVRLSGSSKGIGVSVRDNGKGFDLEKKGARVKGIGLVSMEERARLLGGFLRIHSLPKEGTKVCAWIPSVREDA